MSPINTVGKNSQQILSLIQKQLKTYNLLLNECTKSGRVEAALINHVQVSHFVCQLCLQVACPGPVLCLSGPDVSVSVPRPVCVTGRMVD